MENIKGLKEYLNNEELRTFLKIPNNLHMPCIKLAQGEYNINFLLVNPVNEKKLVLRINTGSQMHLKNQIEYEYKALEFLKDSNRTPMPIFLDDSKKHLDFGLLIIEYLEGRTLNYKTDLRLAAEALADIHSIYALDNKDLLSPNNPLKAILDECNEMFKTYLNSTLGEHEIKKQIERLLLKGKEKLVGEGTYSGYKSCINTELNSGNFLINGENNPNYIIDWEKPLLGNPVQDLGHFLAPTTTFWKTDVILNEEEIEVFKKHYLKSVNNRFVLEDLNRSLELFIAITCLRGITWCSMAWVEYLSDDKLIKNKDTFLKLQAYLKKDFLDSIEKNYFK